MRSISFRAVLIVAAVGFFALGLISTFVRPGQAPRPGPNSTPTTRMPTPVVAASQVSVLVLGVDSVQADPPSLLAVWLISFRPPGKRSSLRLPPRPTVAERRQAR
jgi:hypothetical protein